VRDAAFRPLYGGGADVWMLGEGRVYGISRSLLLAD
jgi:hypothetical protein